MYHRVMPGIHLSPFLPLSAQAHSNHLQSTGNEIEVLNANPSLFEREEDPAAEDHHQQA